MATEDESKDLCISVSETNHNAKLYLQRLSRCNLMT